MDYPFNLKGILYFPKLSTEFDTLEGEVKLYNSQVFVADNIKEVVPEFLLLLKGIIDCPDLPLNVSRSFLQNDGFVRKTSDYITKKVATKLTGLYKTKREDYEKFWDDISPFIKFGILKNDKFNEKVKDAVLYKTTSGKYVTIEEYLTQNEGKLDKEIYYVTDETQQSQYIKMLDEIDVDSVILSHNIDSAFISHVESTNSDIKFKRVDSDLSGLLTEKDDTDSEEKIKEDTEKTSEFRRMQDMMKMYSMNGLGMDNNAFPSEETLVLNRKHPLVEYILTHAEDELSELIAKQVYDLAMISHKPLSPDAMSDFIKRSNDIMKKMI